MRNRPAPVTVPMTEARDLPLGADGEDVVELLGLRTMASMRSWLSLVMISNGSMPSSRTWTSER